MNECPKCGHNNAMLSEGLDQKTGERLERCRDCGHEVREPFKCMLCGLIEGCHSSGCANDPAAPPPAEEAAAPAFDEPCSECYAAGGEEHDASCSNADEYNGPTKCPDCYAEFDAGVEAGVVCPGCRRGVVVRDEPDADDISEAYAAEQAEMFNETENQHKCGSCSLTWTTDVAENGEERVANVEGETANAPESSYIGMVFFDLTMIRDLGERLEPGSVVPSGECPDCDALCYLVKEEAPAASRVNVICERCGSDNVSIEAFVHWSIEDQRYEVTEVCDKGHYCGACEGECHIKEIPWDEEAKATDPTAPSPAVVGKVFEMARAANSDAITATIFPDPLGWLRENANDFWPDSVSSMDRTQINWDEPTVCELRDEEEELTDPKSLTADDLVAALAKLCELVNERKLFVGGVRSAHDLRDGGNWDCEVVDAFWQIAYHGEVIYG